MAIFSYVSTEWTNMYDDDDSMLSVCGAYNCYSVKRTTEIIIGAVSFRMLIITSKHSSTFLSEDFWVYMVKPSLYRPLGL